MGEKTIRAYSCRRRSPVRRGTVIAAVVCLAGSLVGPVAARAGPVYHPDGVIGRPSFSVSATYSSAYSDRWSGGRDLQCYHGAFTFTPHPRITLSAAYRLRDNQQFRHEVIARLRLYTRSPKPSDPPANADGPLLSPVLSAFAGQRFYENSGTANAAVAELSASIPLTRHLTIEGGYRYHERIENDDALSTFGRTTLYMAAYEPDSMWINPDGPVGQPVARLTVGGSGNGYVIAPELLAPLQSRLTVVLLTRFEWLENPERTVWTGGFGLNWYPSH